MNTNVLTADRDSCEAVRVCSRPSDKLPSRRGPLLSRAAALESSTPRAQLQTPTVNKHVS